MHELGVVLTKRQMYRLTIRATQENIPGTLLKLMQQRLAKGS